MAGKPLLACAALAVLCSGPALAQSTSHITGVVRDETGQGIRGATVRAEFVETALTLPTTLAVATDNRGRFIFLATRSGDWQLTVEAPGFYPLRVSMTVRLTGQTPDLELKLARHEAPEQSGMMAGIDAKALLGQLASAAALLDEGKYDQAIAAYREIRTKTPALTLVNLQLGNAYLMKKAYPEAEAAYREILNANSNDADGLFAMGTAEEAEGNVVEAMSWYQKASGADARWTKPLMRLAALARQAGDRTAAAGYLTKAIEIDPGSADAVQAAKDLR